VLVLAIDTSSAAVTAALVEVTDDEVRPRSTHTTVDARGHGEYLAPMISACLADTGHQPKDLHAIVAGLGPGPFTGLRVGLVTAAVLGETLGIPTYGVSSLDGIAGALTSTRTGTLEDDADGPVLVATDARRKEVYWAVYHRGARLLGPEVSRPQHVPTDGLVAMAGNGAKLYEDELGLPLLDGDYPDPTALVRVAADRMRSRTTSDVLTPLYLRRPDAVEPGAPKAVSQ